MYPLAHRHLVIYLWSLNNKTTILAALPASCVPFWVSRPSVTLSVLYGDIHLGTKYDRAELISNLRRVFGNKIGDYDHRGNHDRKLLQLVIGRGISGAKNLPKINDGVN